jgi:hypothetical protein
VHECIYVEGSGCFVEPGLSIWSMVLHGLFQRKRDCLINHEVAGQTAAGNTLGLVAPQRRVGVRLHSRVPQRYPRPSAAAGLTLNMFLALMFSIQPKHTLCLQGTNAIVAGISSLQIWHSSSPSIIPLEATWADSLIAASPWPHTEAVTAVLMAAEAVCQPSCSQQQAGQRSPHYRAVCQAGASMIKL